MTEDASQIFHLPPVKIMIIAPSSTLIKILTGLLAWLAMVVVDGALAALVEIIVIIAVVITIEICNKNAIYETLQSPKDGELQSTNAQNIVCR